MPYTCMHPISAQHLLDERSIALFATLQREEQLG
jgi:hypothetical protein